MENNDKDQKILQILKSKGPLLPIHIVKEIGWNTILVGAALSDLSKKGHVKISNVKIGGSPVYYVQGQEYKLQDLYKHLHEKEQKAYELLKAKKILKDKKLEPVVRVALRNIKDFAKPLEVTTNDEKEIFWKWYLLNNQEAESMIREILKQKPTKKEDENEISENSSNRSWENIKEEEKEKNQQTQETQNKLQEEQNLEEKNKENQEQIEEKSPFLDKVKNFFEKNDIEIVSQNIVRKTNDAEFIVKVPTSIGLARYFCKARSKKKFNDSDLSNVYVQSESKKLPVLFLITGELTKKAESMLDEQFKNITIKKI